MNFLRRYVSLKRNWIGLAFALVFVFVAVAVPWLAPTDEDTPGAFKVVGRFSDPVPHPPGFIPGSILGTMPGQYDVFHALLWGCRDAMRFGLLAALGAFAIGVVFGAVAGYAGGAMNALMMRVADAFLTFPPLAGAVLLYQLAAMSVIAQGGQYYFNPDMHETVVYFSGPMPPLASILEKVDPLLIALILFSWMPHARLVNSMVQVLRRSEFVLAAQAVGGTPAWVVWKHLLPNSIAPAIVLAARDVGSAVILQATMVVIGLGTGSPWGTLLATGRDWITAGVLKYWWVYVPATLVMVAFGFTWNLVGDGLSESL